MPFEPRRRAIDVRQKYAENTPTKGRCEPHREGRVEARASRQRLHLKAAFRRKASLTPAFSGLKLDHRVGLPLIRWLDGCRILAAKVSAGRGLSQPVALHHPILDGPHDRLCSV